MLFERWREIVHAAADKRALTDLAAGRTWTFRELDHAVEQRRGTPGVISFPQGHSAEFILDVLHAWRSGQIVCPLEPGQAKPQGIPAPPRDIVHLKSTSATTGASRLVAFTADQLAADARNIVATMGLRPDWPNLGIISLAHSYGFSNLILPLLLHGIPLVLVPAALPEALRTAASTLKEATLPSVPALWRAWNDAGVIPGNIKLAISAGAPLPLPLEQQIYSRYGLKIHNFFGSSECGGIAYDRFEEPRDDAAHVGAPMENVELSIAEDGCLQVGGDAVASGYWPEAGGNLDCGTFRTSDIVEILNGEVYFRGRACDRINVAGRKVAPEAIERVLANHPEIKECLVFGVPSADAGRGEHIVAVVARRGDVALDALKQFAVSALPAWQVPRDWWIVDTLQANERGKLSRSEVRKGYLQSRGAASVRQV